MDLYDRELIKEKAFNIFRDSNDRVELINAIHDIAQTYFYRSLEHSNYKKSHPDFEIYFNHWIYINLDKVIKIVNRTNDPIIKSVKSELFLKHIRPKTLKIDSYNLKWIF